MEPQIFKIVFEDDALMVIEKCRPFLSQKGDQGEGEGLYEFVSRATGKKIFPVHRLDREVLGLMIFGKTAKDADHLSLQFKERKTKKIYEAWVYDTWKFKEGVLSHYLRKNSKNNHVTVFTRPTEGAKYAELSYEVLEEKDSISRVKITLKTGRGHQIRVQLAKEGHSIIGDTRYGNRSSSKKIELREGIPIQLKSIILGVEHPRSGDWCEWQVSSLDSL